MNLLLTVCAVSRPLKVCAIHWAVPVEIYTPPVEDVTLHCQQRGCDYQMGLLSFHLKFAPPVW